MCTRSSKRLKISHSEGIKAVAQPSYEVLKDVPSDKLDQTCKVKHLNELALSITDWQSIAPLLGLTEADESEVEDCKKIRTKNIRMLRKWRSKFGAKATYRNLAEVLLKLEETDLAEKLCDLIQQPHSSSGGVQTQDSHKLQCTSEVQRCTPSDLEETNRSIRSQYANTLKQKYRSGFPTFLTLQWPPPPTLKVFNLAMITRRVLQYGRDEELVWLLQRGSVSNVVSSRRQVTLEQISSDMHSNDRKVILIQGAPGAGKSTLAWHICTTWEAGKLFHEFELVLFVQLRDPAIQSAQSLEDLFPAESLSEKKEVVSAIQYCHGRQVLIVLDSWDEFTPGLHEESVIKNLICDPSVLKVQYSALIITSRAIATGRLQQQRVLSTRIEIAGFLKSEVRQYFTEAIGDPEIVQKLSNYLRERPVIEASCYLPLNTAIVTHLFLTLNHTLPDTLHEVFTSLVICCIKRHLERQGATGVEICSLDNLPPCIQEHFHNLCKLAYHGVMENKATFSHEDLQSFKLPTQPSTLSLMQGVASFSALGLTKFYNFFHLSTQELLAAFFIAKMQPEKQVEVFNELFEQPRFANVFQFYAAFTKLQTEGIWDTISKIVNSKEELLVLSLLHCLYEAQDDTLCRYVGYELQKELDLSEQTLNPLDCLSIGYFIRSVCTTDPGQFKLRLAMDQLDEYSASLLERELFKYGIPQPDTAVKTCGIHNLYLVLVRGNPFTTEYGKIISKLGLYLKALQ